MVGDETNDATSFATILFDLDGTLTDPKLGITGGVRHALARYGIVVDDLETLTPFIGPPLPQSFQRFYGFDEAQSRQAVWHYREYFSETGIFENTVYPGIAELLARLTAVGKRLAVATSKPTIYAERILRHFGLREYFAMVAGGDMEMTRLDKGLIIGDALAALGDISPTRAIMVGDREHDILGARHNGMAAVGVAYGYGSLDELRAAGPEYILATVAELRAVLTGEKAE